MTPTEATLAQRFLGKIAPSVAHSYAGSQCFEWFGWRQPSGHGQIRGAHGKNVPAHRVAYEVFVAPIPLGMTIDHLCRWPPCQNPWHLEAVSMRENILRAPNSIATKNLAKTACVHGHPYTHSNTLLSRSGHRRCRACRDAYELARAADPAYRVRCSELQRKRRQDRRKK